MHKNIYQEYIHKNIYLEYINTRLDLCLHTLITQPSLHRGNMASCVNNRNLVDNTCTVNTYVLHNTIIYYIIIVLYHTLLIIYNIYNRCEVSYVDKRMIIKLASKLDNF